jgi:hypothetical protein
MSESYTNIIDDLRLLEAPGPMPLWAQVLAGLLAAGLAWYLVWRRRRLHARQPSPEAAAQTACEDALAELEKVHKNLARENSRPYAIAVSGIVRRYIERRFNIRAPRRSTEEFLLEARRAAELSEKYQEKLGYFLKCCDFLKFAKGYADTPELELLHNAAVIFVTETQLRPHLAAAGTPAVTPNPEGRR